MQREGKKEKKRRKKKIPPSSYDTMPHYYPTEQIDIVKKMKTKRKKK